MFFGQLLWMHKYHFIPPPNTFAINIVLYPRLCP